MTMAIGASREELARPGAAPALYAAAVASSAALVFVVEPLVGRLILPLLGGSPAVWNTSLAVFQAALLAGYAYAHQLQRLGGVRRQMIVHLAALGLGALVLPVRISGLLGEPWSVAPALWLALTLALSIGLPFALLSATAPLLQAWFARSEAGQRGGRDIYGLYAASNLGSLLALAAYPTLIEPSLGLSSQSTIWSVGYGAFVLLLGALAASSWRTVTPAASIAVAAPSSWRERMIWMLLAAAPSSLLLGVTAHITSDVASAPFLWVIPLELYLLTFVIAFSRWSRAPPIWLYGVQIALAAAAFLEISSATLMWPLQLTVHLLAFTAAALVCHLTLASRRPPPERLTDFYLWISVGGVVGGSFNAFLAPLLFDRVWEYPAALVLALLAPVKPLPRRSIEETGRLVSGVLCALPLLVPQLELPSYLATALLIAPAVMAVLLLRRPMEVAVLLAAMGLAAETQGFGRYQEHHRSFFGVVHLSTHESPDLGRIRVLVHGVTLHGAQALDPALRCTATTYYAPATVIGQVFQVEEARRPAMRMAAVGLGAGTVATFVRPADRLRFFEIDPLIVRLATDPKKFSFVKGCAKGPVDIVLGDARLTTSKEAAGAYDLVLVDAFSSDSIPTHLMTLQAIRGYLRLLKPGGVVALHLSNRNLNLEGPAAAAARAAGASALFGEHWVDGSTSTYAEASGQVLLLAREPGTLDPYRTRPDWRAPKPDKRPWTDDYTNVWGAMLSRFSEDR